jgi:hypothetical protein
MTASSLFLAIAGYAVFFSAFLPLTGNMVSLLLSNSCALTSFSVSEHDRTGYTLQISNIAPHPNHILFCDSKLGWMAVLSKLIEGAVRVSFFCHNGHGLTIQTAT